MKPKGIVIGSPTASPTLISEEESILRGDDIISPTADVLVKEMIAEEQLALDLTASMGTALEKRAVWVVSFIYDSASGDLPISVFLLLFSYSIIHNNICVFTMSTGSLLPGVTSGSTEVPGKMMEFLALALEVTAVEGLESSNLIK